jgi:predicted transposase YdaD
VLLGERHDLPIESVILLLRPEADRGSLTGVYQRKGVDGRVVIEFHYKVVRLWQIPAERFLQAGLGVLPLAPVAKAPVQGLPGLLRQMQTRLEAEASPEQAKEVWTVTFLLLGLNHPRDFVKQLFQGVPGMKESSTYQMILEEGEAKGKIEEARKILLDLARLDLGNPDASTQAALEAIDDVQQLESLIRRVREVTTWAELLQARPSARGKGRKRGS